LCGGRVGPHANVIKLISLAFGQVLGQLETPGGS
jgi:hypothetical protein